MARGKAFLVNLVNPLSLCPRLEMGSCSCPADFCEGAPELRECESRDLLMPLVCSQTIPGPWLAGPDRGTDQWKHQALLKQEPRCWGPPGIVCQPSVESLFRKRRREQLCVSRGWLT